MLNSKIILQTTLLASMLFCQSLSAKPFEKLLAYPNTISPELSERFASLALTCIQQEFPNKISRTTDNAEAIGRPKKIFPAFYGCFDWHSSVHGHWLLVRLLRVGPQDASWRAQAIQKLNENLTKENLAGELANFSRPERGSWERPYGLAWYLQLTTELRQWNKPQAETWLRILQPLEAEIAQSLKDWLPKLAYPIRLGTHNQSAFAFGLMLDWAREVNDTEMEQLLIARSMAFHQQDVNCPLAYEPSGEDFLSPCLMEADLMRRIMTPSQFSKWLAEFLPMIPNNGSSEWLAPGIVKDASDGKLVHLDGVNLSRAWNLYNIARALPDGDRDAPLVNRNSAEPQVAPGSEKFQEVPRIISVSTAPTAAAIQVTRPCRQAAAIL